MGLTDEEALRVRAALTMLTLAVEKLGRTVGRLEDKLANLMEPLPAPDGQLPLGLGEDVPLAVEELAVLQTGDTPPDEDEEPDRIPEGDTPAEAPRVPDEDLIDIRRGEGGETRGDR